MQAFLIPKKELQVSVNMDTLVKILDNELPLKEGQELRVEIYMTTVASEKRVFKTFAKVDIVTSFIDQISDVVRTLERNRENSGPIGLVRPSIYLTIQPLKNGSYETQAYVDAFMFRPGDEKYFSGHQQINLADMAGRAKDRANDLVNSAFLEEYKFVGEAEEPKPRPRTPTHYKTS